jgi:hypothetical protein
MDFVLAEIMAIPPFKRWINDITTDKKSQSRK